MKEKSKKEGGAASRSPWFWIPSLYFAEGIPYVVIMTVSVIMFKRLGLSNTDIALYTSWLYLPWVIKPLWSPVVDILKTKRFWIIAMQLLIGIGFLAIAMAIPLPNYLFYTLAVLWVLAFASATHDIAADGFYMLGLSDDQQAWFVGIRSTFYRFAMITGQGLLIILAGYIEGHSGLSPVTLPVQAGPQAAAVQMLHPDSLAAATPGGGLRMICAPERLIISSELQPKARIDSLFRFTHAWNLEHGFYPAESTALKKEEGGPSWWSRSVARPLEDCLRRHFGEERELAALGEARAGNVGAVYFRLSQPPEPGKEVVVNFSRDAGDKSINLVEGSRLVFTESNWNKPAIALIQLDPKLQSEATGSYVARAGNIPLSWSVTFIVLGILFLIFFFYHGFALPRPASDVGVQSRNFLREFFNTFVSFFRRKHIGAILAFLLLYRFGEAQLVKLIHPFMLDSRELGGLGMTTGEVGLVYGTIGIIALTIGGLLGGFVVPRRGLKFWLFPMLFIIHLPDLAFIYLSQAQPDNLWVVSLFVALEQFGYGFGFTAYMLYMIYVAGEGEHKTAHYAICTGLMALGMMVPGMFSGWLQEIIGYRHFFIWVVLATIPSFIAAYFIPLEQGFGKKK
ncbi:MAG: muropeptide transporter [bacterium ADurb.Bin431]|mgnify:FL=1|nr:MAG: muropeptide transporter [bacterium ADurb.Bin431]HOH06731.1 MFS transporter [bacterium]